MSAIAIEASSFHGIVPPLLVFAELGERLLVFWGTRKGAGSSQKYPSIIVIKSGKRKQRNEKNIFFINICAGIFNWRKP